MGKETFGRWAAAYALPGVIVLLLAGCSGVLPKKHDLAISSFKTFGEAHDGYDKVVVNQTTVADLKTLGFDPDKSSNIAQLTYLEVLQQFLPRDGMPFSTIPTAVQTCITAQNRCIGYAVTPKVTNQKREGSVFLDFFNFRRKTSITGWQADSIFVLLDGTVVYKLWSGEPNIETSSTSINPLGPVQDLGSAVGRAIPSASY
jgi:hypothetical protein